MNHLKKRKPREPRGLVVLGMILTRKGGKMKDRRLRRQANKEKRDLIEVSSVVNRRNIE